MQNIAKSNFVAAKKLLNRTKNETKHSDVGDDDFFYHRCVAAAAAESLFVGFSCV